MSSQRKIRADKRATYGDPINFTCGICHQVHKFNSDKPYDCTHGEVIDEEEE